MRLIDADKLIECMSSRYNEKKDIVSDNLAEGFMQIEKLIKEQPTAYDVDKVVEELNKIKKYNLNLADMMIDIQENGTNRHFICLEDAIEIVKAGGNS